MPKDHSQKMRIVIVGGGTAGWLTAGLLAASRAANGAPRFSVTMIEPPDIPIIGVGEGTWPTMRETLRRIGVREKDFLRACSASFKQGSKFCGWTHGGEDFYYHPFEPPLAAKGADAARAWLSSDTDESFSNAVSHQERLCEAHRAPKTATSPDYAGVANYGYHFDAGALAGFLRDHCVQRLGVEIVADAMTGVEPDDTGAIKAIGTRASGAVAGDFFIDCTGFRAVLMKGHFGAHLTPLGDRLIADRALAVQSPYNEDEQIRSVTMGTAQDAGWIWDIGLATRRGVGYVHSSAHTDPHAAEATLRRYLARGNEGFAKDLSFRLLTFTPGYLDRFWEKNCVAVGLSAGFVEPLEASSIMLTELAARELAGLLADMTDMNDAAAAFNGRMTAHWRQVVHFLKLHYALSARVEPFWRDNRDPASWPSDLRDDLQAWSQRPPSLDDFAGRSEIFPAESYQYVLYGATGAAARASVERQANGADAGNLAADKAAYDARRYLGLLPANRDLIG